MGRKIHTVFVATLLAVSIASVGLVGTISATGITWDGDAGRTGNIGIPGEGASLDFKGCSEVWIIFPDAGEVPVDATIEVYDASTGATDTVTVTITEDDLETVPRQYGDNPLYKFTVHDDLSGSEDDDKILAVSVDGSQFVENPNRCARTPGNGNENNRKGNR